MTTDTQGPWGEDNIMLYDASRMSDADAMREFIGDFDDWRDYAISVEGPLMYHEIPGDYDARIEPCECEDEHRGQHEVWKVIAQDQEPTARFKGERAATKRIVEWLRDGERIGGKPDTQLMASVLADCIERGEHRADPTRTNGGEKLA